MDWTQALEEERAALGRIVVLLRALAVLAERAAGCSPAVRGLVLWALRYAESVARDFVAGESDMLPASMPIVPADGRPADAMRLAVSFRALARQLDGQARLVLAMRRENGGEPEQPPSGRMPAIRSALDALSTLAAFASGASHPAHVHDTS